MENKRKSQIAIIAVLAVAVVALGVGFAAFSTALTITSNATVTPDDDTFQVVFADENHVYEPTSPATKVPVTPVKSDNSITDFTATTAQIDNSGDHSPEITNLSANFTAPGQSVTYTFEVDNIGQYDAYLNSITFENVSGSNPEAKKVCTVTTQGVETAAQANNTYVQEACGLITLSVTVHGSNYTDSQTFTSSTAPTLKKVGSANSADKSTVVVTIAYAAPDTTANGYTTAGTYGRADGPFSVAFGNIKFNYSTVK